VTHDPPRVIHEAPRGPRPFGPAEVPSGFCLHFFPPRSVAFPPSPGFVPPPVTSFHLFQEESPPQPWPTRNRIRSFSDTTVAVTGEASRRAASHGNIRREGWKWAPPPGRCASGSTHHRGGVFPRNRFSPGRLFPGRPPPPRGSRTTPGGPNLETTVPCRLGPVPNDRPTSTRRPGKKPPCRYGRQSPRNPTVFVFSWRPRPVHREPTAEEDLLERKVPSSGPVSSVRPMPKVSLPCAPTVRSSTPMTPRGT